MLTFNLLQVVKGTAITVKQASGYLVFNYLFIYKKSALLLLAGYPVKPVGLICSAFKPSDDATLFSFLIPSNFFAVLSLRQAAEMMTTIAKDKTTSDQLTALVREELSEQLINILLESMGHKDSPQKRKQTIFTHQPDY